MAVLVQWRAPLGVRLNADSIGMMMAELGKTVALDDLRKSMLGRATLVSSFFVPRLVFWGIALLQRIPDRVCSTCYSAGTKTTWGIGKGEARPETIIHQQLEA